MKLLFAVMLTFESVISVSDQFLYDTIQNYSGSTYLCLSVISQSHKNIATKICIYAI